jgi:hypothetical protein
MPVLEEVNLCSRLNVHMLSVHNNESKSRIFLYSVKSIIWVRIIWFADYAYMIIYLIYRVFD